MIFWVKPINPKNLNGIVAGGKCFFEAVWYNRPWTKAINVDSKTSTCFHKNKLQFNSIECAIWIFVISFVQTQKWFPISKSFSLANMFAKTSIRLQATVLICLLTRNIASSGLMKELYNPMSLVATLLWEHSSSKRLGCFHLVITIVTNSRTQPNYSYFHPDKSLSINLACILYSTAEDLHPLLCQSLDEPGYTSHSSQKVMMMMIMMIAHLRSGDFHSEFRQFYHDHLLGQTHWFWVCWL